MLSLVQTLWRIRLRLRQGELNRLVSVDIPIDLAKWASDTSTTAYQIEYSYDYIRCLDRSPDGMPSWLHLR